jgi:hypothetical protein
MERATDARGLATRGVNGNKVGLAGVLCPLRFSIPAGAVPSGLTQFACALRWHVPYLIYAGTGRPAAYDVVSLQRLPLGEATVHHSADDQ